MEIAITGSSGLIGTALAAALREAGHRPVALVRRPVRAGADEIEWQPAQGVLDAASLEGIDGVVNLAGAGIGDKRWTDAYKKVVRDSRVVTTRLLAETLAGLDAKPSVLLSGSGIGVYGDRGDEILTEASAPGQGDFMSELCVEWEEATTPASEAGIRTAHLRTGIVLADGAGALSRMVPVFRMGIGGPFGAGRQYMSWITLDDHIGATMALLEGDLSGPVNLVAPGPVPNKEFTRALGRVLRRPTLFPIPPFGPKLLFGSEMAESLVLFSQRVMPQALTDAGHDFAHTEVEAGLRSVLAPEEVAA